MNEKGKGVGRRKGTNDRIAVDWGAENGVVVKLTRREEEREGDIDPGGSGAGWPWPDTPAVPSSHPKSRLPSILQS